MSEHNPFDLSEQERMTAQAADEERLSREREKSDLCWLMGNKQGRRFMWRLLGAAGVFHSSFNTNNAVMAFNEGKRNLGLQQLTDVMEHCPGHYNTMLNEHKDAREKDDNRAADTRNKPK